VVGQADHAFQGFGAKVVIGIKKKDVSAGRIFQANVA
jgi:hypothetical protein